MAGAIAQRVSGMGFALVVAPVLVLLIGPFDGVLMVNICGAASALMVVTRVWREISWKHYFLLAIPAVAALLVKDGAWGGHFNSNRDHQHDRTNQQQNDATE